MENFFSELGNITNRYYKFLKDHIDGDLDREVFFDEILLKCPEPSCEDLMGVAESSVESAKTFCLSIMQKVPNIARYISDYNDLLFGLYMINEAAHVYNFNPARSELLARESAKLITRLEVMVLGDPIFQQGKQKERADFSASGADANGLNYSKEIELLRELVAAHCADGTKWKTRTEAAKSLKDKILACNRKNKTTRPLSEFNIEKRITEWLSEMEDMDKYFQRGSRKKAATDKGRK